MHRVLERKIALQDPAVTNTGAGNDEKKKRLGQEIVLCCFIARDGILEVYKYLFRGRFEMNQDSVLREVWRMMV